TQYLGFYPSRKQGSEHFFDLKDGVFTVQEPAHPLMVQDPLASLWDQLLSSRLETIQEVPLNSTSRRLLLHKIIDFYQLHVASFGEVRSRYILEEVLAG